MTEIGNTSLPTLQGDDTALCARFKDEKSADVQVQTFLVGEETALGEGDSYVVHNFLDDADEAFKALDGGEIIYQQWYHMPDVKNEKKGKIQALRPLTRIKVAQTDPLSDGTLPHYRFPVNNQSKYGTTPFTKSVRSIRDKVQAWLDKNYAVENQEKDTPKARDDEDLSNKLNHAVVLLYRGGDDRIGLHKDKALDLEDNMPICSISLGQARTYILQDDIHHPTKRQEITLGHGDLLVLGPKTNQIWYHSIRQMSEEEVDFLGGNVGHRVSVTLRAVATRLDTTTNTLSGKGAAFQTLDWPEDLKGAHRLINDDSDDSSEVVSN